MIDAVISNRLSDLILETYGDDLIRLWPLDERSGTSARDLSVNKSTGTYSGVVLRADTIQNGDHALTHDGVNDYVDIETDLHADMNFDEHTIGIFTKTASWTSGTQDYLIRINETGGSGGEIRIYRPSVNNQMNFRRNGGGTTKTITFGMSPSVFFFCAYTCSIANDRIRGYIDGTLSGTPQTGNVAWDDTGPVAAGVNIGAGNQSGLQAWDGQTALAFIANRESTAVELLRIAKGGGLV